MTELDESENENMINLRPKSASTCWPIGFDQTDDEDDDDGGDVVDEAFSRGGSSGGCVVSLLPFFCNAELAEANWDERL